jgi:transmembrane sensor
MCAEEIDEKASLWLAREQNGLTPLEQGAFETWLGESPRHMVAYLRLKTAWERAGRLAALKTPMRAAPLRKGMWAIARIPAIAAAVTIVLYAGSRYLWPLPPPRPHADLVYSTAIGQTHRYQLADGTRMELNTGSRVRVAAADRLVTLESGEAFFQVVHDPRHPFVVNAGKRRITDIGTKFTVYLDGDTVRVLVSEGQVKVETQRGMAGPAPVMANVGHVVIAQGMEALVLAKSEGEITSDLSWRDGLLTFDQQPLPEVAKAFNRYNMRHIQVEGRARRIRIGGSFKADNVDAFVVLLQQGFGLSVKNQGDKIVVSR